MFEVWGTWFAGSGGDSCLMQDGSRSPATTQWTFGELRRVSFSAGLDVIP